jgi:hypothetical protein
MIWADVVWRSGPARPGPALRQGSGGPGIIQWRPATPAPAPIRHPSRSDGGVTAECGRLWTGPGRLPHQGGEGREQ